MRNLHIIMPMAGEGSRFLRENYLDPKPLIKVDGMNMFTKSLSSLLPLMGVPTKYTFIINESLKDPFKYIPQKDLLILKDKTEGPLMSVWEGRDLIKNDEGLLILDCDLWFQSKDYFNFIIDNLEGGNIDAGAIPWFPANSPRYSFAKIDGDKLNTLAEKEVISNSAIAGAYYFSKGEYFKTGAQRVIDKGLSGEKYISFAISQLLKLGLPFKSFPTEEYRSFGTPEELRANNPGSEYVQRA